ncbi:hypothetical protein [Roseovarius sp. ZX-A-9]|uniref:hypothetical protein n=1 Tax=Roseovarius sp. ZX-A-9 TaxID=3014783 RepID=UPI00232BE0DF|nr:hypothetical protein [Roseovarius sp. ZX-A-9]
MRVEQVLHFGLDVEIDVTRIDVFLDWPEPDVEWRGPETGLTVDRIDPSGVNRIGGRRKADQTCTDRQESVKIPHLAKLPRNGLVRAGQKIRLVWDG